jgi:hypothetical protein
VIIPRSGKARLPENEAPEKYRTSNPIFLHSKAVIGLNTPGAINISLFFINSLSIKNSILREIYSFGFS